MFRFFCGYLGSRRKGSPISRSQQGLFVVGSICLARCHPREGQRRKDKAEFLLKIRLLRERKNKLENRSSGKEARQCHLLLINTVVSNEKCTLPGSAPALWNVDLWQLSGSRSSWIPHAKMPSDNTVHTEYIQQRRTGGTGACGSVWVGMHLLILIHLAGLCFPINNKVTLGQMTSVLPLSSQIPLSIILSPTKSPKVLLRFWRSVKSLRHLKPQNSKE